MASSNFSFNIYGNNFAKEELVLLVLRALLKGLQQGWRGWGQAVAFTHMQRGSGTSVVYTQGDIME